MNRHSLRMKYHPAKKEISFSQFNSGKETPIFGSSGSVLSKYINMRGQFVLQNQGNKFFGDILEAFDGEESVNLEVTMTQKDYEDFTQMIDYFNATSEVKISATLLAELPDMNATYEIVKKHGEDSVEILRKNRDSFYTVESDNENVRICIENFAQEINDATNGILEKIELLEKNSVNVCFSGPYSSGKSLLINSLIGYAILPTDIRPETAAMFTIKSPKTAEDVRVNFNIIGSEDSYSEIAWNPVDSSFSFIAGPYENDTRKKIQEEINAAKGKAQYEQLRDILNALNNNTYVERVINVFFPIAIDNDKVQFTFYDTPGTDSGVAAHRNILKDALAEQTHSILVFVTYPNGLSGGGNKALLEYLGEIEQKGDRSTIDLGRSLFVINYADSLSEDEQFEAIRTGKITNKKDVEDSMVDSINARKIITIKLSDKKVFFTTAKYAYFSAAKKNGIISNGDARLLKFDAPKLLDNEFGLYYRHDRCASSEYATNILLEKCNQALEVAQNQNDDAQQIWIASGLFALAEEIKEYGERYASAVKVFSIIDGVDKALARLNRNAQSIERQNNEDIQKVEIEIKTIRDTITKSISEAKRGKELSQNSELPQNTLKQLRLDADSISEYVINPARGKVNDILLGFWQKVARKIVGEKNFSPSETAWDGSKESSIEDAIQNVLGDYSNYFTNERRKMLEGHRDEFITAVKSAIQKSGELSDAAKAYITAIDPPEIEEFSEASAFGDIYRAQKKTKKVLWMNKEYLDKEAFMKDMNKKLRRTTIDLADSYRENYRNSLNSLLRKVEGEFVMNLAKYSVTLRAKQQDKNAMEELRRRIMKAVDELHKCQETLDAVIWEAK